MPRAAPIGHSVERGIPLFARRSSCRARLGGKRRIAAHSLDSLRTTPSPSPTRVRFGRSHYQAGRPKRRI